MMRGLPAPDFIAQRHADTVEICQSTSSFAMDDLTKAPRLGRAHLACSHVARRCHHKEECTVITVSCFENMFWTCNIQLLPCCLVSGHNVSLSCGLLSASRPSGSVNSSDALTRTHPPDLLAKAPCIVASATSSPPACSPLPNHS
jgi:hypothetical protein